MSEHVYEDSDMEHERYHVIPFGSMREEIVRCMDCTYYDGEPDLESSMPKCWRDPDHRGTAIWTRPDGFCAWGERTKTE